MSTTIHPEAQTARATWAAGDWPAIAKLIWDAGDRVVRRAAVGPGEDVLDIGCVTGNAAIRAAARGARAVGLDLMPELFPAGCAEAAAAGVEVEWVEGDAEALPFADASFDVAVSTFGCMFAPRHEVAAHEAARVLRPGGRLSVFAWTPEGAAGEMFRLVAAHLAGSGIALPEGPAPSLWGHEAHVAELFAGTGVRLAFEREVLQLRVGSAARMIEIYERDFGPIVVARRALEPLGALAGAARRSRGARRRARNRRRCGVRVGVPGRGRPQGGLSRLAAMATPNKLVHTCMRVRDIDASLRFYEALGFERRGKLDFGSAYNIYMGVPGDGDTLELTVNSDQSEPYDLGNGYGHIALTVDDLDGLLAKLQDQGIEPEKPPYAPGGRDEYRICFVADPDGYRVELIDGGQFPTPQDP